MMREAGHEAAIFTRSYPLNQAAPLERFFPAEIQRDRYTVSLKGLRTVKEILYSSSAVKGLRSLLREFRPDVVHAHNIYGGLSTSVLDALKASGTPVVMTLHDLKLLCPSYLMLNHGRVCERCKGKRFYNAILTRCHKDSSIASAIYAVESYLSHLSRKYNSVECFIAPSMFLLNKHREFGFDPEKFVHIPNPIDATGLTARGETGGYLFYFGRLSREKGIRTLISAYGKVKTDVPLHIAGEGAEREAAEDMAAHQRGGQIRFLGYLKASPLGKAIDLARAVILPSECYENAPMAILESFIRGKPVIGARIGGIPEMIDDGVNGYLFEPGNPEDLKRKIEVILGLNGDRLMEMGRAARSKVEREYSARSHYERLMQAYGKALGA